MTFLFIIKILGDLLFYFAIIASLSDYLSIECPFAVLALIFAISTGVGRILWDKKEFIPLLNKDKKNIIIRIVPLIPCLLTFTWASSPMDFICLIPPVIYVGKVIYSEKFNLIYKEYVELFKNLCIVSVCIFVVSALLLNWENFLFYEAGFLVCGVFLMRQLRLYADNDLKGNFLNLSSMLSVVFINAGICGLLYMIIQYRDTIWSVIKHPVSLLTHLLSIFLSGIVLMFQKFLSLFGNDNVTMPDMSLFQDDNNNIIAGQVNSSGQSMEAILQKIFIVIAVVAISIIIFKMFKSLQKEEVITHTDTDYEIIAPEPSEKKLRTSKLFKSNREKIRLSYIKYLKGLEKEYGKFGKSNTSEEIYEKTSDYSDSTKVLKLRALYLRARYDLKGEISDNDVTTAKRLIKEIIKHQ